MNGGSDEPADEKGVPPLRKQGRRGRDRPWRAPESSVATALLRPIITRYVAVVEAVLLPVSLPLAGFILWDVRREGRRVVERTG